jgi:pectate lyase
VRLTNNISDLPQPVIGSTIRLGGAFDAVAILHDELSECGDKCIAVTSGIGDPVPAQARVTVAFNYIHDHDKTVLFGTYNCVDGDDCTVQEALRNAELGPGLFMTLEGNALIRDAQRNPRVFGRAMLHAFDNYIAFQPYIRPGGVASASYGILVSNGARALIEHNWLVPLDPKKLAAVFTAGTPGTEPPEGDRPGEIRFGGGPQVQANTIAAQSEPQQVLSPYYIYDAIPLETVSPAKALACVATRAGRNGAAYWSSPICPTS